MIAEVELLSSEQPTEMTNEYFELLENEHFWFKWRHQKLCEILPDSLKKDGGPFLDVGTGNSLERQKLELLLNVPVDGTDLNLGAMTTDSRCLGRLMRYDLNDCASEFRSFYQGVFILDVLEHVFRPVEFLQSLKWHLKPGGYCLINVPAIMGLYSAYDKATGHVRRYNARLLHEHLLKAGFEHINLKYWGFLLLPVLVARTFLSNFYSEEQVYKKGFAPPGKIAHQFLHSLRKIETALFKKVPIGTSLIASARKPNL